MNRTPVRDGERVSVLAGGAALSFLAGLDAWRSDRDFRAFCLAELAAAPFAAFFWEMPPIRAGDTALAFEYVTIDSPQLRSIRASPKAFAKPLAQAAADRCVAAFPNLRGTATLIAPKPGDERDRCGHIAAFVRGAPETQQHDLLALTGEVALAALSPRPLWISTCGLAVPWLHVRVEARPVYYSYAPYRDATFRQD